MLGIERSTEVQAQRLDQLLHLNRLFEIAQTRPDQKGIVAEMTDGTFIFDLDNDQRNRFYYMLRGRLRSMPHEGLGNIGYELIAGKIMIND